MASGASGCHVKFFYKIVKIFIDKGGGVWYIKQAVAPKTACTLKIEQ